jgi:hypothetical protein
MTSDIASAARTAWLVTMAAWAATKTVISSTSSEDDQRAGHQRDSTFRR